MPLFSKYTDEQGVEYTFEYHDADSFDDLPLELCDQVFAICFVDDKIILVNDSDNGSWGLIGGGVDPGEKLTETLIRELKEEGNLEVLAHRPIGYQKAFNSDGKLLSYQVRYVCRARPFGPFVADPDGDVTEIKFIDPDDYKQYFNWGEISDRLIERSKELIKKL